MSTDFAQMISEHLTASANVKLCTASACGSDILAAAEAIALAFKNGGKLLLCGNGGSAADCQHLAAEFVSRLSKNFERPGLPAIALTTDTSFITAFANDCGFEGLFARQVQALGKPGDVLIGISTSGNSVNIISAAQAAKAANIFVITLTGECGELRTIGNVSICVPSTNTQHIQESHIAIEHLLCAIVERILFAKKIEVVTA